MRVIVTRPQREAQSWVQALTRRGLDAVALPLIEIQPQGDATALRAAWNNAAAYAALMFVSGAAVEHFFSAVEPERGEAGAPRPMKTRCWCTGPGTAAALLRQGVDAGLVDTPPPGSAQFDSETLWALVQTQVTAGSKVLIVRGGDAPHDLHAPAAAGTQGGFGRDWLAQQLRQAGAEVAFVQAYQRSAPTFTAAQRAMAGVAAHDGSVWLFTSAQAVANLAACLPRQPWSGARALATHARIAHAAREAGFGVVWESRPSISDVVASIESIG